jgi:hypothetical protein
LFYELNFNNQFIMKINSFQLRSFILVLITGLILVTCKKDDKETNNLVGTWTTGTATYTATVGDKTLTQYYVDVMGMTPQEAALAVTLFSALLQQSLAGTITINANNTYTSTLGGVSESGTWSLSADGKKLTIDPSTDDPVTLDVTVLTSNQLTVGMLDYISEDLNGDEIPETITVNAVINFTR